MRVKVCFSAILICALSLPLGAAPPPDAAFITMSDPAMTMQAVHDVIAKMAGEEVGGHAYHVMPVHTGVARELSGC